MSGMRFSAFRNYLPGPSEDAIRFVLPDGEAIPACFHLTEVGHVTRRFIDCGGTIREAEACLLQTWVPKGDLEHRLTAGKLAKILDLSQQILPPRDLDVEVEYDRGMVAQYTVDEAKAKEGALVFYLGNKKTDCLAREACAVEPANAASGCCGGEPAAAVDFSP